MLALADKPGLLFVLATLLPLASFTILLLLGGIRNGLRPHRNSPIWGPAYEALGLAVGGRGGFFVGFAAIVIAFFLSFSGFCLYLGEYQAYAAKIKPIDDERKQKEDKFREGGRKDEKLHAELHKLEESIDDAKETLESHWTGRFVWAGVYPSDVSDAGRGTELTIGYRIDSLAALMFVMVTFVASLIHLFSSAYMGDELGATVEDHEVHSAHGHFSRRGRYGRFFLYLSLFCFSMLNLLLADNLFQIFVSWELVGICSYLLIGFYYERQSASNAANKAFITNRVGDAGFIIGLLILWTHVGTFNFQEIFERIRCHDPASHATEDQFEGKFLTASFVAETGKYETDRNGAYVIVMPRVPEEHFHLAKGKDENGNETFIIPAVEAPTKREFGVMPYWMLVVAGLGIFLGCVGKSAQFPLQVWLPDAMEGPTPVSALIHAATMVAAGVYLVGRAYPIFTPEVLLTIAYIGGITLFVAASIAVVMTDIKKVLAYSTVSQLGYMMLGLGVGGWSAGLFHLVTHAFFKALLFLGSGSVIYGCHHQQDMRKMGGLFDKMKITGMTMLMGVFAISGYPLFSGWYSKDSIVASAYGFVSAEGNSQHMLLFILPLVTAGITTFYMFRMWFLTFTGKPRDHHVYEHAHETPWMMTTPLIILAVLSVVVAWGERPWDARGSRLDWVIKMSEPESVAADFGEEPKPVELKEGELPPPPKDPVTVAEHTHHLHEVGGAFAIIMVLLGTAFALGTYYYHVLDPQESMQQFHVLHKFLMHKWYFDEVYSAALVRPAVMVSRWAATFDRVVIDGFVNSWAKIALIASSLTGAIDRLFVDGLVNLVANVVHAVGLSLRRVQTGYLRSYVLFLALAAMGVFVILWKFAGPAAGSP
jgi:NADH-quinone oxidoreductase subunit L